MGFLDRLETMAQVNAQRRATPKGAMPTRLAENVTAKATDKRLAAAFRAAVLKRDEMTCRCCGKRVRRTLELVADAAHVHHLRGRRVAPEDRYNVKKAITLCGQCHTTLHTTGKLPKAEKGKP